MVRYLLFIILAVSFLALPAYAEIDNAYTVNYLKAEVIQTGQVITSGSVSKVELMVSIPQEDEYQDIVDIDASRDYDYYTDEEGNRYIVLKWEHPSVTNRFEIRTNVTVRRRTSSDLEDEPEYLEPTELIESEDSEVEELAGTFSGGDFEKIAKATEWVNENIKYDMAYADKNMSASWVLKNKRGVCDEFTTLFLALTRSMGYPSAYVAGYAYSSNQNSQKGFIAHGWAEVDGMPVDPTWGQAGFIDATHIKFARIKDAKYIQALMTTIGSGSADVEIDTKINVLESEYDNMVITQSSALEEKISDGYAVIHTKLEADGCILAKMNLQSCVDENNDDVFSKVDHDDVVYFCGEKEMFYIFRLVKKPSVIDSYRCPITVSAYAGNTQDVPITIAYGSMGKVDLIVDKTVFSPGESYVVDAKDSHIFTDQGDYGFGLAEFTAPYNDFKVYGYNSGTFVTKTMAVNFTATPVDVNVVAGNKQVEVYIENLAGMPQTVTVSVDGLSKTRQVTSKDVFVFDTDKDVVQVVVESGEFTTTVTKRMSIAEDVKTNIISGFFKKIADFFRGLFR